MYLSLSKRDSNRKMKIGNNFKKRKRGPSLVFAYAMDVVQIINLWNRGIRYIEDETHIKPLKLKLIEDFKCHQ